MAGDVSAGILAGTIELDDQFTSKVDRIVEGVALIEQRLGGMTEHGSAGFLQMTASIFSAETALKAFHEVVDLVKDAVEGVVIEGSKVENIESAYEHLAAGANLSYDAIARLREGTHGQVTDMELLKIENHDLAAGMMLSAAQVDTMTKGAFLLAKATGGDLMSSLERVNDALLTGRVRSVQLLTGKLDLVKVEEDFATKLGLTAAQLSPMAKLEATRIAVIERMGQMTERLGEATDTLAGKYTTAKVQFLNFMEKLEGSIEKSPVIQKAFDVIGKAIGDAVGDDQQKLITTLSKDVDQLLITIVGYAGVAVSSAKIVVTAWYETKNAYTHVLEGIQAITYVVEEGLLKTLKVMNVMPSTLGAYSDSIASLTKDTDRLYNSMAQGEHAVEANRAAEESWGKSIDRLREPVTALHDKMEAARKSHEASTGAVKEHAAAHDQLGAAAGGAAASIDYAKHSVELERAEVSAAAAEWKKYDQLKIKEGGSAVAEQKQQIKDWMDDQLQKLDTTTKAWVTHYNAIIAMGKAQLDTVGVDMAKLQKGSRAEAQNMYDEAEATFQYAMAHSEKYSADFRYKLRQDRDEALANLRAYGSASNAQLQKVQDKADDVADHVLHITQAAQTLLKELSKAEFDALGGQARINQIEQSYLTNPGRREGGSGRTGLDSADWAGYLAMLEERKTYQQLVNAAKQFGASASTAADHPMPPTASDAAFTAAGPTALGARASVSAGQGIVVGGQQNNFYIDGNKDPRAVANEVLNILGGRVGLSRQLSSPGR